MTYHDILMLLVCFNPSAVSYACLLTAHCWRLLFRPMAEVEAHEEAILGSFRSEHGAVKSSGRQTC